MFKSTLKKEILILSIMGRFLKPSEIVVPFVDEVEKIGRLNSLEMMFEEFEDFDNLKKYYLGGQENDVQQSL